MNVMIKPSSASEVLLPAADIPLESMDVSDPRLLETNTWPEYFKRLRDEDPVHYLPDSPFGAFWSITRFEDIQFVDSNFKLFSSEPVIVIGDRSEDMHLDMFIAMDPPKHDEQRAVVNPVVRGDQLRNFEPLIRERTREVLDSLPIGEEFNWVDKVSIELTTRMLATLFDFPFEDRRKLTRWSDVATADETSGIVDSEEQRREELGECLAYFTELWNQRVNQPPAGDLVSMLAHGESTKNMGPMEYLGNLILLIVGGNDTTRNSISGGVRFLNQFPDEYQKLMANPGLIPNMVPEIIRFQTPLAYMRRTTTQDVQLGDKLIPEGDRVLMWYISGNRDSQVIDQADRFWIDRPKARQQLSFGFGIHRCMGNRLAEMQLRVLWEEILNRFERVEVVGEPTYVNSNFVKGYSDLPVIVHRR